MSKTSAKRKKQRKAPTEAQIQKSRERKAEAMELLQQGLNDVANDGEQLRKYLEFRACFRDRSPNNTMLLFVQAIYRREEARHFMGYRAWMDHGRAVRKGEKGYMVIAPLTKRVYGEEAQRHDVRDGERACVAFKVASVFDIAQTDPIEGMNALETVELIPELVGDDFADLRDTLEDVVESLDYSLVHYDPSARSAYGYANFERREVGIARAGANSEAATLAHEIAHEIAHVLAHEPRSDGGENPTLVTRELQAEGAAYLACFALGLDTTEQSLPYLKHYIDPEVVDAGATDEERAAARQSRICRELKAIDDIAWDIIDRVSALRPEAEPASVA